MQKKEFEVFFLSGGYSFLSAYVFILGEDYSIACNAMILPREQVVNFKNVSWTVFLRAGAHPFIIHLFN